MSWIIARHVEAGSGWHAVRVPDGLTLCGWYVNRVFLGKRGDAVTCEQCASFMVKWHGIDRELDVMNIQGELFSSEVFPRLAAATISQEKK